LRCSQQGSRRTALITDSFSAHQGVEHDNTYLATQETYGIAKTGGIFIMKPNTEPQEWLLDGSEVIESVFTKL
jgi:hypothetical protein